MVNNIRERKESEKVSPIEESTENETNHVGDNNNDSKDTEKIVVNDEEEEGCTVM